ncbi:MAG: hypothetical protein AAFP97_09460 [Pseudomonadota bacterium]
MPVSEKHSKFRTLAESRTNKAIEAISRIGNLSNQRLYEWEEAEVKKMIKALRDTITEVESRFSNTKSKNEQRFKF